MQLDHLRKEIETRRLRITLQRKEIRSLQRAGISTASADELLERVQLKLDELCQERDRQAFNARRKYPGTSKVINGPAERRFR